MSTLSEQDASDPKSLLYYAPRRLRDSANEAPTIQPRQGENEHSGSRVFTGRPPANDAAAPQQPVADDGREGARLVRSRPGQRLQHLFEAERKSNARTMEPRRGRFAFAIASGFAAAAGIAVGIVFLDSAKLAEGRGGVLFAKENGRAVTTQPVLLAPTLAVADGSGDVNELLPLGVKATNYTVGSTVNLSGLLKGTELSAGAASGEGQWRIAVDDLPNTLVIPPRGYLGPMNIVAELRGGNGQAIVRSPIRFLWTQPSPDHGKSTKLQTPPADAAAAKNAPAPDAPRQMDSQEIAVFLKRAEELVSAGDLPAARLLLLRVAETRNARAAFALGATYDPNVIKRLDSVGAASNLALALSWYRKARDWGLADATERLDALASTDR